MHPAGRCQPNEGRSEARRVVFIVHHGVDLLRVSRGVAPKVCSNGTRVLSCSNFVQRPACCGKSRLFKAGLLYRDTPLTTAPDGGKDSLVVLYMRYRKIGGMDSF